MAGRYDTRRLVQRLRGGYGKEQRKNLYDTRRLVQMERDRPQQLQEAKERREKMKASIVARNKVPPQVRIHFIIVMIRWTGLAP